MGLCCSAMPFWQDTSARNIRKFPLYVKMLQSLLAQYNYPQYLELNDMGPCSQSK